jgi:hypothetical protein
MTFQNIHLSSWDTLYIGSIGKQYLKQNIWTQMGIGNRRLDKTE